MTNVTTGLLVSGRTLCDVIAHVTFLSDFKQPSFKKLERLGDIAVDAQRYDEAISHYATALSFDPPSLQDILIKRGKAYLATGSWKQALEDANQVHYLHHAGYLVHASSLGDHGRSIVAIWLRGETYSFAQGGRLRRCSRCI